MITLADAAPRITRLLDPTAEAAVTTQTLRNWIRKGMPHETTDGGFRVDPEAAAEWARVHAPRYKLHGGKRRNAGRKPGRKSTAAREHELGLPLERTDEARAASLTRDIAHRQPSTPPANWLTVADTLKCTRDELAWLAKHTDVVGLAPAHLQSLNELLKSKKLAMDIAVAEGELVKADDAQAAWAAMLRDHRRAIEGVFADLPDAAISALGLDDSHRTALTALADTMCRRLLENLRGESP